MVNKDNSMKKWFIALMIAGPAIFFIVYFLVSLGGDTTEQQQEITLPGEYIKSGEKTRVNGQYFQAGISNRIITQREMNLGGGNTAVPKKGNVFLVIPVFSGEGITENDFNLIDTGKKTYSPLEIEKKYPAAIAGLKENEIPDGMQVDYLTFKVDDNVKGYYLVMESNSGKTTWYFEKQDD